jgi:hypothetical protein
MRSAFETHQEVTDTVITSQLHSKGNRFGTTK